MIQDRLQCPLDGKRLLNIWTVLRISRNQLMTKSDFLRFELPKAQFLCSGITPLCNASICSQTKVLVPLLTALLQTHEQRVPGLGQITWQIVLTRKLRGHCGKIERKAKKSRNSCRVSGGEVGAKGTVTNLPNCSPP